MTEISMINYRGIYVPTMQMKDICMIAYLKINVPTVQMRELSMIFHIRIWVHRAGERNMRVSLQEKYMSPQCR